jgi:protein O-GlcNAc transferase
MSAARSPAYRPGHIPQQAWEKIAGFAFGVMFVAALLVLAIAFPQPTSFQYDVFRIVLAIACAGVAAVIPGFLAVSMDAKGLVIRAGGALAVFVLVYFFSPARLVSSTSSPVSQSNITATDRSIAAGGAITATAQPGGTAIITTGHVLLDAKAIAESLVKTHERELAGFREREQTYQDHVKALTNTVTALAQQQRQPNGPPGIEDALAQLRQGHTAAAETIFETVLARKAAEGQAANQQAAAAARHLGTLAVLHDMGKALTAYRHAVALDPANAEGWNLLGLLLYHIGYLDEAVDAFNQVRALGTVSDDQEMLAVAYGNLGIMYEEREDLTQAEAMHRKALELYEALGQKAGMALAYSHLGNVYQRRGDLTQAEAMSRKGLELYEALGQKAGMAGAYINLGEVYERRGDLTQAEAMYRKALELSEMSGYKAYGHLGEVYQRQGDLTQAEAMYRKELELGEMLGYKQVMALAYGHLGTMYEKRGDLTQAEAMYRKELELSETLGYKKIMAIAYGHLGNVYQRQGDLTQAEAMYRKALELGEMLGYKQVMAVAYGNLGGVYQRRGDLTQAEAMYRQASTLFQEIGATSLLEQVRKALNTLHVPGAP